jgi:hypothetical protein
MTPCLCRNPACRQPRRKRKDQGGWAGARGLCQPCYEWARDCGFPDVIPVRGPRLFNLEAAQAVQSEIRASRVEEYVLLRRMNIPPVIAGQRVGVSQSTAYRYESELREQRQIGAAA